MSQPVKLSDALILDARVVSADARRSIAGQIEFWAGLGKAIEVLLRSPELAALQRGAAPLPLSRALALPGTPAGDRRLAQVLAARPFPQYVPSPDTPGLLVRVDADGTRTTGRFVRRKFVAARPPGSRKPSKRRVARRA